MGIRIIAFVIEVASESQILRGDGWGGNAAPPGWDWWIMDQEPVLVLNQFVVLFSLSRRDFMFFLVLMLFVVFVWRIGIQFHDLVSPETDSKLIG